MKKTMISIGMAILLFIAAQSAAGDRYPVICADQPCGTYIGKLVVYVATCFDEDNCDQQSFDHHFIMKWVCKRWLCYGDEYLSHYSYGEYCDNWC